MCSFIVSLLNAGEDDLVRKLGLYHLKETQDVKTFFPATIAEIETRKKNMIEGFHLAIDQLLSQKKPTFENTAYLYDLAFGALIYGSEAIQTISMVSTDPKVRQAASKAATEVAKTALAVLSDHPELYELISSIDTTNLKEEHLYYLQEVKKNLKSLGLGLPAKERLKVRKLQEKLVDLGESFSFNIREDQRRVAVTLEELAGMDEAFCQSLEKDEKGNYILTTDYPIVFPVLSLCQVESTRRQMYRAFSERGHPQNNAVLKDLSKKRHELARIIGFDSYAHLQLSGEMAENPERVRDFLNPLAKLLSSKQDQEFELLKANLPEGIKLNEQKQIQPWDLSYSITDYKKKHLDLDEEGLKAYFPLEATLTGLMKVYESFFNLKIEEVLTPNLWHPDVRLLRVSQKSGRSCGFIILDLHPRSGKYTHACVAPQLPAWQSHDNDTPSLSVLICNFPKGSEEMPALMRPSDVRTFFHEFGHALHNMLGSTDLISTTGCNTKRDFVELPSQMLEEWLWDKEILQMCSSHYLTKEKLPSEIIERMLLAKNAFSGIAWMRQIMLSHYSLDIYSSPCENVQDLWHKLDKHYRPQIAHMEENHSCLSFGHLYEYGACYYGYLWSRVFALDVFEKIKKEGLLNPKIGELYIKQIIGRGGSLDPNQLLIDFLGRKPTQAAFLKSIGMDQD